MAIVSEAPLEGDSYEIVDAGISGPCPACRAALSAGATAQHPALHSSGKSALRSAVCPTRAHRAT